MRVASWTPLELEDGIRSGNGEKRTSAHSLVCWERAWIHVQGFRLSSSIRLTGFNITPLAKLHATANFCSMKKNLTVGFLREKRSSSMIYTPAPKKLEVYFCLLSLFAWNLIDVALHSQIRNALVLFSICNLLGRRRKSLFGAGEKIQWMRYRIALNLIFWCYVLTLYLNYVL